MEKITLVFVLLSLISFANAAERCFVFGAEGSLPRDVAPVTVADLKGSRGPAFLAQYNSYGIPFLPNLHVENCLATFGNMQCVYANGVSTNPLVPYNASLATLQCQWDLPASPVKLGTWNTNQYYATLNQSVFDTWVPMTCPTTNSHYTLLYNTSCGSAPTPPPSGSSTCCYYFSHPLDYQTYLCQKGNMACPDVSGYVLVYNQTSTDCSKCSLSAVPETIQHKYTFLASADKPEYD